MTVVGLEKTTKPTKKNGQNNVYIPTTVYFHMYVQGEVLVWELESSHLAQRTLRLPAALGTPFTALAVYTEGSIFLGDQQGGVWRLQV